MPRPKDPKQPKLSLKDRRRRLVWVKVAAGTAVVALSLVVVWYVARLPEITVAGVEVSGTNLVDASNVKDLVESKLAGSYLFLVPRTNSLVLPRGDLAAAVVQAYPEVDAVSVIRDGWQKVTVLVTEREPSALWCLSATEQEADAGQLSCYLMDKNGFIFAPAKDSSKIFTRFFGVLSGEPIGQKYLPDDFASFKSFVEEISSTAHRTPQSVLVEQNDDASITFVQGGVLKFVRTADHESTLNNIASVFSSRRLDTKEKLDYADFRFGNKVYVKFIEE